MFVGGKIVSAGGRERLCPGPRGVRTYADHKCSHGYTLFSTAFGAVEYLIDMNGMVVHTWAVTHSQYAEILPNGNLMADNYGSWLEEISPTGEQLWKWEGPYHHDFHVVSEDEIVCLIHNRQDSVIPGFYVKGSEPEHMQSDIVICINRKGDILWEFPFRDHVEELHEVGGLPLPVPYGWANPKGGAGYRGPADWAHTNTIEVLPDTPAGRKDERFRAGNILFSFRNLDIIGVADIEKNEIVWAWGLGVLDGQHQPTMTPEGTIVMFDNGSTRRYSAVVEIDPTSDKEVWRYEDRARFFSHARSGVQRLPNGNTLVAESDAGRIFEVTREKEIVWDYYNPFLSQPSGSQGLHVYRATRYGDEQVEPVLAAREKERVVAVTDHDQRSLGTYSEVLRFYREGLGG